MKGAHMAIIVSKDNRNARRLEESQFNYEDNLQEYIIENPDVVPIYDIEEDARLFIAAREFPTNSGLIDALGFDQNGNIYVVETKLFKNPDKRTVVAQALDYGASLWRNANNFDDFLSVLNNFTDKHFNKTFREAYEDFFELEESEDNFNNIESNLDEGVIKFVVLMDSLDDRLKDLVVYVNQNSKFDIYAVDFKYYKHDQFEIIIPKLYGAEVKKDLTTPKSSQTNRKWNEESFFDEVDNNRELISEEQATAVHKLWDWSKANDVRFKWGIGKTWGSFGPIFSKLFDKPFVTVSMDSHLDINYGSFNDLTRAQLLRDTLKKYLGHTFPKVTNLPDDDLKTKYPIIAAKDVPAHLDKIIMAFDEFIQLNRE